MPTGTTTRPSRTAEDHDWLSHWLRPRLAPLVAVLSLVLALAAILAFGTAERTGKPTDNLPAGSESAQFAELFAQLPERDDDAVVLIEAATGQLDAAAVQQAQGIAERIGATSGSFAVAPDTSVAIFSAPLQSGTEQEKIEAVKALRAELDRVTPSGLTASVTGPDAVLADLAAVVEGADLRLLGATMAVVAVLLIVTYRSPILFIVPLVVVAVADRLASVVASHLLAGFDVVAFSGGTTAILSILVFGAGTDYALLLISRYRSELETYESRYTAMVVALRRTAEAVLTSAARSCWACWRWPCPSIRARAL